MKRWFVVSLWVPTCGGGGEQRFITTQAASPKMALAQCSEEVDRYIDHRGVEVRSLIQWAKDKKVKR